MKKNWRKTDHPVKKAVSPLQSPPPLTALILAGDRHPGDPVAAAAGVPCKALTPVGGKPMVLRVLDALNESDAIDRQILCGPAWTVVEQEKDLHARVQSGTLRWMPPQTTPSASAAAVLQSIPDTQPVLLTTADHALLTADMVNYFCARARDSGSDLAVALTPHQQVSRAFPGMRRTAIRLQDGAYCSCNLFAFFTPQARAAAAFWKQVEQERKHPFRIVQFFGWQAIVRYITGTLSLTKGFSLISSRLGFRVCPIMMPFPQAAVDVDTIDDWKFVQTLVSPSYSRGRTK